LRYPHLMGVSELNRLIMAPALYLSVLYFTMPNRNFKKRDYLHFVPFLLFLFYRLPDLFQSADAKIYQYTHQIVINDFERLRILLLQLAVKIQFLIYWIFSFIRLVKHEKQIYLFASDVEPIKLNWLRYLLLGLVVILVLWINDSYFHFDFIPDVFSGCLIAAFFITYHVIKQEEIFPFKTVDLKSIEDIFSEEEKNDVHQYVRLNESQIKQVIIKLERLMNMDEVYLNSDLSLLRLAEMAELSTHDLSYVLNTGCGKSFYQYVNHFRVEKAKSLLVNPEYQYLSIVGIAYECGFNSKTAFNTTFKKLTGFTPTVYKHNSITDGTLK
jgi:AraC-like DNA-binding protein